MQALFGKAWITDESWSSDGRVTKRRVERPRVSIDEWMNALEPGDAWLRVAPIDRGLAPGTGQSGAATSRTEPLGLHPRRLSAAAAVCSQP